MVITGRYGQKHVAEMPLSLLALTRHHIEPQEEQWFCRCVADYLRSFPLSLLETARLVMLLSLVGPLRSAAYTACAIFGWLAVMGVQASARRYEKFPDFDQKRAMQNRAWTIRLRGMWSCVLLCWGLTIIPESQHSALLVLGLTLMVIDAISTLTLPHLALFGGLAEGAALIVGSVLRDGLVPSGSLIVIVLMSGSFLHWAIYNFYYLFATRRIRTKRLGQSNETIQLLLNQYDDDGSDWLYEIDARWQIHNASARFAKVSGRTCDELEGISLLDLFVGGENAEALVAKLGARRPFRNVVVSLKVGEEDRWWSVSGRPLDGGESGWRGFIADVTQAKQAEAKVAFMAHYDLLTELPNRTLFNATLARAFSRLRKDDVIGLLYVDLDHFKAVNDSYGHAKGDLVLAEIAKRLESVLRPRDMVARLGGDEFVILLPDLQVVDAGLAIAERVLEVVAAPLEIDGQFMPIGASVGIAFAPFNAKSAEELLQAADLAMYDAKSPGRRGIAIFDPDMQQQMKDRRALEIDLRAALVRQELELHYQPLVDIKTGATCGYEALLRWHHQKHGLVSPTTFIPIAEETGLIVDIGAWVIRSAIAEAANWPDHLTVAVNLSPAQVRDDSLITLIVNALGHSGVAPQRLELEITESMLMQDSEEVLSILHRLRKFGVRIALDDFGTGHSSLNYLRSFPFDKIKIDRCFVNELADREDCQAIVRSVIALANDLNMTTTAEGVEVLEQLEALKIDGCNQVQGFYFSKALPAGQLHHGPSRPVIAAVWDEAPAPLAMLPDFAAKTDSARPAAAPKRATG